MTLSLEQIAEICHETNRLYCLMLGDDSQVPWPGAQYWQKQSALAGVMRIVDNPKIRPDEVHAAWLQHKIKEGWEHGPMKDAEKKEHPCIVHYDNLPEEQKAKDRLFRGIVLALTQGDKHATHR